MSSTAKSSCQVDHQYPANRIEISLGQPFGDRHLFESPVSRLRDRDQRMAVDQRESTKESGTESDIPDSTAFLVHFDEPAASAVDRVQFAVGPQARGMRHGKLVGHDLVRLDVDDDSLGKRTAVPAACNVRLADCGDIFGPAVDHPKPVEVAAVFGDQLGDELGFPDRPKAIHGIQHSQAGMTCVHEYWAAFAINADFVDVNVSGNVRAARH
jgi:hypothetical protein